MKAIGIVSGGLDSLLATRLVQGMGFEVLLLHFVIGYEAIHLRRRIEESTENPRVSQPVLDTGAECEVVDLRREFSRILAQPRHGYGANLNPCIDCKILMLSRAKERMDDLGAAFVFTGEVLGQRPMSQRMQALSLIAKESGLGQHLVRPLCGGLLPPTAPEVAGIIRRDQLECISGRSRTAQMALAEKLKIRNYPTPAGGCLLTDPAYAARARELMQRRPGGILGLDDPLLLLVGRHLVLPGGAKAVIGRRQQENDVIERFGSLGPILAARDLPGPSTLVEGTPARSDLEAAARLTARYSKGKHLEQVTVRILRPDGGDECLAVPPRPPENCRIL